MDTKKVDFAIVTKKFETFDTIQKELGTIKQVIVASSDLDLNLCKNEIEAGNISIVEQWLNQQKWYNYDARIPHVKLFWLHVFDKKRPTLISNYIIPSENELLTVLSRNTGLAIVWDINAKDFIEKGNIQLLWDSLKMPTTSVYVLSRKNDTLNAALDKVVNEIKSFF